MDRSNILGQITTWAGNQPEIFAVYLYGSQAEGHANALSDIDIAILVDTTISRELVWKLDDRWAAEWISSLDLRIMNLAPIDFRFDIITRGDRIWARDLDLVAEVESITRRKYWDLKPLLDQDWSALMAHITENRSELERAEYQETLDKVRAVHRRVREASETLADTAS